MAIFDRSGKTRRAVVTGAAGFIGSALSEELRSRGYEVQGIDIKAGPGITEADLAEPGPWRDLLKGADVVVHAAARVGDRGTKKEFRHDTVETTRTVMQASAEAGVGRVVHLSSTAVHGKDEVDDNGRELFFFSSAERGQALDRPERGLSETAPPQPTGNPYTDTSIAAEQIATSFVERGLPVTVARLSEVYGPNSVHWTIRPVELIRWYLMWVPPEAGVLSPLYIDDAVEGIITLAEHPDAPGEIFQLCGNEKVSVYAFFSAYADAMDIRLHRTLPGAFKRLGVAERIASPVAKRLGFELPGTAAAFEHLTHASAYSNEKADRILGWRPKVNLNSGIPRTLDWLRENGYISEADRRKS